MNGQGRPQSKATFLDHFRRILSGLILAWCCALPQARAETTSVRVRIEWSGPEPEIWIGSVAIPGGTFSDLRLLGLDADQPGAYVNQRERILIIPRFAARKSGFEAMVSGELEDVIHIVLTPDSDRSQPQEYDLSIAEILSEDFEQELGQGHKLKISRTTGDELRVRFPRDSMVFVPGERPKIDVRAMHLDVKPGSTLRARFRIREASIQRGDVSEFWNPMDEGLWTRTETVRVDETGQIAPLYGIELPIPDREGSYNLSIDLSHRLPAVGNVAKRSVQFVVVDPRRPPLYGRGTSTFVTELNPDDSSWRDILSKLQKTSSLLPGSKKGPWSNVSPIIWHHQGSTWTQLKSGGWIGYSLSGAKPNVPHMLEVEFPAGEEQDVGISIVEPKSNAELKQIHGDAGVTIGDEDLMLPGVSATDQTTRHRIVFWPSSTSPIVVISNQSRKGSIAFGKIRLEAFHQGLPVKQPISGSRKRIAVLDGEMLQSIFFADARETSQSVDDWQSFLVAGNRLVSYLRYAGYDGVSINVASDGSSLFPSRFLLPTARFDRGIFARNRHDPFQKDVLEMLLQLFDREGLVLIPSLEFATPLPELEAILAKQQAESRGIELLDLRQRSGAELQDSSSGIAPYYNPLDTRVQQAIGHVVNEVLRRYSHHASFRGINVECKSQGFTQFPGISWAFDQATLNAFVTDTLKTKPTWKFEDLGRTLATQLQSQADTELTQAWLQWRATRLTNFYGSLAKLVGRSGDRQLFLSMTDLMRSEPWQRQLRPALPRKSSVQSVLLALGLDAAALQQADHLVVLRPHRIAPLQHLGSQAVNLEVNEQDIQQSFHAKGLSAAQFDYESRVLEFESFDAKGPTRRHHHRFIATASRVGLDARRHLAMSLAQHDDQWIFEGGRMFPFGQEAASSSFFQVFRELPARRFDLVKFDQPGPVVSRISKGPKGAVAYFVNTSPWVAKTGIQWRGPRNMTAVAIGNSNHNVQPDDLLDRSNLNVTIEPYGIFALRFDHPDVQLVGCSTELPAGIAQQLRVQLDEIVSRGKQIEAREPITPLRDPSFEQPLKQNQGAWTSRVRADGSVGTDLQTKAIGNASLRLYAPSANAPVSVTSHEFLAPETGRLVVSLKLRKGDAKSRPPLILRLQSTDNAYQPFHLFENISSDSFSEEGVSFVDLPTDPNLQLRISLDLVGPGEVWIDDIQLFDKWIIREEKKVLNKIIQRAVTQERNGDLAACYQTLSGYWPRFLLRHVPPAQVAMRSPPRRTTPQNKLPEQTKEKPHKSFDLFRFVPRFP